MGKELQGLSPFEYNHLSNPPAIKKAYLPKGAELGSASFFEGKWTKK